MGLRGQLEGNWGGVGAVAGEKRVEIPIYLQPKASKKSGNANASAEAAGYRTWKTCARGSSMHRDWRGGGRLDELVKLGGFGLNEIKMDMGVYQRSSWSRRGPGVAKGPLGIRAC